MNQTYDLKAIDEPVLVVMIKNYDNISEDKILTFDSYLLIIRLI